MEFRGLIARLKANLSLFGRALDGIEDFDSQHEFEKIDTRIRSLEHKVQLLEKNESEKLALFEDYPSPNFR